ncbi:Cytokine receptor [Lucilia cuprina]|nr:Cytokine receptor [Lucilia cuprina]
MMRSSGSSIWLLISIVVINLLQCIHCGTSPGGTAPLDITDFKCRGYDYTYMVCNFTKPHNVLLNITI